MDYFFQKDCKSVNINFKVFTYLDLRSVWDFYIILLKTSQLSLWNTYWANKFTQVTIHEYLGHGEHAVVENDGYGLGQVGFSMKLTDSPDSVCES